MARINDQHVSPVSLYALKVEYVASATGKVVLPRSLFNRHLSCCTRPVHQQNFFANTPLRLLVGPLPNEALWGISTVL